MKMYIKSIKLPDGLREAWIRKYGKLGDKRIRELMIEDLKQ